MKFKKNILFKGSGKDEVEVAPPSNLTDSDANRLIDEHLTGPVIDAFKVYVAGLPMYTKEYRRVMVGSPEITEEQYLTALSCHRKRKKDMNPDESYCSTLYNRVKRYKRNAFDKARELGWDVVFKNGRYQLNVDFWNSDAKCNDSVVQGQVDLSSVLQFIDVCSEVELKAIKLFIENRS